MSPAPNAPTGRNFDDLTDGDDVPEVPAEDLSGASSRQALTAYSDTPQFDRNEVVLPRLRIAQGLTAEVQDGSAKPGQLLLSGFEPLDTATVVPLMFARMRELRGDGEERNTVFCSSSDAVHGVGDPGGVCSQCPMAEWGETTKRGKEIRTPPKCTFIFSYMCYIVEHKQVAVIEFRRTSERVGRLLNTMVAQRGLRKFGVKLGAEIKREGNRTYAIPTISAAAVDAVTLNDARNAIGG